MNEAIGQVEIPNVHLYTVYGVHHIHVRVVNMNIRKSINIYILFYSEEYPELVNQLLKACDVCPESVTYMYIPLRAVKLN